MPWAPNQVTVNEYRPGEGIPYHCDTHSAFGPVICSLSLLAEVTMGFRAAGDHNGALGVRLPGRSLLVLSGGAARYGREHSIARRGVDFSDDGLPRKRGRRLSITFRTVEEGGGTSAAKPCTCRWPELCDSQTAGLYDARQDSLATLASPG